MSRTMLCNAALMVRLSNFYSSFKPNFLFELQVVRESNRSNFEGPLYLFYMKRDSSVGNDYSMSRKTEALFNSRQGLIFLRTQIVQTRSVAHPASNSVGIEGSSQ
jgi:hypothetical protein